MKWLLVVLVLNQPVKTDLLFANLDECLQTESKMRREWAERYNRMVAQDAFKKMSTDDQKNAKDYALSQATSGTCIPSR